MLRKAGSRWDRARPSLAAYPVWKETWLGNPPIRSSARWSGLSISRLYLRLTTFGQLLSTGGMLL
jgi:hypothetical protein